MSTVKSAAGNPVLERWPLPKPGGQNGRFGRYEQVIGGFTSDHLAEAAVRLLTAEAERDRSLRLAGERGELSPIGLLLGLQERATRETFEAAARLCRSGSLRRRILGLRILRELRTQDQRRPFVDDTIGLMDELLSEETRPAVLAWIVRCLTWQGDIRTLDRVLPFVDHPDVGIRRALSFDLAGTYREAPSDPRVVSALIRLAADPDTAVRGNAVYDFQETVVADSPAIRHMLEDALSDADGQVRGYAVAALKLRGAEDASIALGGATTRNPVP